MKLTTDEIKTLIAWIDRQDDPSPISDIYSRLLAEVGDSDADADQFTLGTVEFRRITCKQAVEEYPANVDRRRFLRKKHLHTWVARHGVTGAIKVLEPMSESMPKAHAILYCGPESPWSQLEELRHQKANA